MKKNNYRVALVCLGCDKNRVDSEVMLARLKEGGFEIICDISNADLIIINTCGFLEEARKESVEWTLKASGLKKEGAKIMITGCMAQRDGRELFKHLTEAHTVANAQNADIVQKAYECLSSRERLFYPSQKMCSLEEGERVLSTPRHYAYLKIADGCNNFCSYCLIPDIRGRYRSRTRESILKEAENLVKKGVKELILVAQDVTKYGFDLYKKPALKELLTALSKLEGLWKIRLLYCYPENVSDSLLRLIYGDEKIANYIDIPLQHISESILRAMNRKSGSDSIRTLFDKLKKNYPEITLRSTFICGFPAERQEDFDELKHFLKSYTLANAGFFAYSKEKGTKAYSLPNQVPKAVKKQRLKELYDLQSQISFENNKKLIGKTFEALVDRFDTQKKKLICRTEFQSPDIDGVCIIDHNAAVKVGDIIKIKITDCDNYDLIGETV